MRLLSDNRYQCQSHAKCYRTDADNAPEKSINASLDVGFHAIGAAVYCAIHVALVFIENIIDSFLLSLHEASVA